MIGWLRRALRRPTRDHEMAALIAENTDLQGRVQMLLRDHKTLMYSHARTCERNTALLGLAAGATAAGEYALVKVPAPTGTWSAGERPEWADDHRDLVVWTEHNAVCVEGKAGRFTGYLTFGEAETLIEWLMAAVTHARKEVNQ